MPQTQISGSPALVHVVQFRQHGKCQATAQDTGTWGLCLNPPKSIAPTHARSRFSLPQPGPQRRLPCAEGMTRLVWHWYTHVCMGMAPYASAIAGHDALKRLFSGPNPDRVK